MTNYKISAGTIARTIILMLSLVNMILNVCGIQPLPIEDEMINDIVSTVWTVGASIVTWWKNQSFTQAALAGDVTMKAMKAEKKATEV